ncbi:MAG: lysophospholipid acyltransferase family protein [Gemmatimonadota bacterium]
MILYRLLRRVARLGLRWYYRSIEVIGIESVPATGPVIVAANHWNALIDALVIACALDRRVRLTAKATLLANPVTRLLVRAVGIIPLRRASDEHQNDARVSETRNAESFSAILDALSCGEVVLIFPEGRSHSEPELGRLKTGCARLALMAQVERRLPSVPIIPAGLTFEAKGRLRSRVVVHIGTPLRTECPVDLAPEQVQALTRRLDHALRDLTLNFSSQENADRVLEVAALLTKVLDRVRPLAAPDPPLADAVRMAQRLESARHLLPGASPVLARDVDHFLDRIDAFRARLQADRIPVNDLWMPVTAWAGAWFVVRELSLIILALPVAFWGRINHWIPLAFARWIGRTTSHNADETAMHTLVSGLVLVLSFYAVLAVVISSFVGPWWAATYLAVLPPSASLDFRITDRLVRALARASAYRTLRANPRLRAELRKEASAIRATARRLDSALRGNRPS